MRPNKDESLTNAFLLPDPQQAAFSDGLVIRWYLFIKILSIQHDVFFQIWRPSPGSSSPNVYTLVGLTYVQPTELRELEVDVDPPIWVKAGDVVGLYFPLYNPIGWTSVPCASEYQRYRFITDQSFSAVVGRSYSFETAPSGESAPCRHYSFAAIFGENSLPQIFNTFSIFYI